MTNFGEQVVSVASHQFETELRAELRAKFMAIAQADIEHTIDEIVRGMNLATHGIRDELRMEYPVTFTYRSMQ